MMKKILILQTAVLAIVASLSFFILGSKGFWSTILGGGCYLIPSFIMVLFLSFLKDQSQWAAKGFIFGESLKIVLSLILMLIAFALWHQSLSFIPFIAGLFAVSHLVFLAYLRVQHYGK